MVIAVLQYFKIVCEIHCELLVAILLNCSVAISLSLPLYSNVYYVYTYHGHYYYYVHNHYMKTRCVRDCSITIIPTHQLTSLLTH